MTLQEKLGKTIIQLRKQRGLAQEKFANDAEIDRRYKNLCARRKQQKDPRRFP